MTWMIFALIVLSFAAGFSVAGIMTVRSYCEDREARAGRIERRKGWDRRKAKRQ